MTPRPDVARVATLRRLAPPAVACLGLLAGAGSLLAAQSKPADPGLVLVRQHPTPVITTRTPGAEGIRYGFEGGRAVKVGETYNPAPIETRFIENPIVTEAPGGGFLAVYDSETADGVGWAYSGDGIRWGRGQGLVLQPKAGEWAKEMRTPLGLVSEGGDRFTLFYTGFELPPDWRRILDEASSGETCAVGFVELRLER